VWRNLWEAPVEDDVKDVWYRVIHDILPTKTRLHAIHMSPDNTCSKCNEPDTIPHRLVECGEGACQWAWTQRWLGMILRSDPQTIPADWLYRPQFPLWPPQRHRAVLWILAHFVAYRCQRGNCPTLIDLHDFLQRARWKFYHKLRRLSLVGNYLSLLDTWQPFGLKVTRVNWFSDPVTVICSCVTTLGMDSNTAMSHLLKIR
jgi:hypothetical protein